MRPRYIDAARRVSTTGGTRTYPEIGYRGYGKCHRKICGNRYRACRDAMHCVSTTDNGNIGPRHRHPHHHPSRHRGSSRHCLSVSKLKI